MADIASSKSKMNDTEINADAPLSEALHEKIGANINYLIDTTDDHETRIDALETPAAERSANFSGSTTSTTPVNVGSDTITPSTSNVFVFIEGSFSQNIGNAGSVILKRGSTTLRTISAQASQINRDFGFLDLNATADSSNTYNIEVQAQASNTLTYNFNISLMCIK